jgi:hypothetical protein
MPVVSARGTSAYSVTVGYFNPIEYVYDAGTDTWCSGSGNEGPRSIVIAGHGFDSYFTDTATINSITVSVNSYTNNAARWASWNAEVRVSGVTVGTIASNSLGGVTGGTITGVTAADLVDPTMEILLTGIRGYSTFTTQFGFDYCDIIVDYTPGDPPVDLTGHWGALRI